MIEEIKSKLSATWEKGDNRNWKIPEGPTNLALIIIGAFTVVGLVVSIFYPGYILGPDKQDDLTFEGVYTVEGNSSQFKIHCPLPDYPKTNTITYCDINVSNPYGGYEVGYELSLLEGRFSHKESDEVGRDMTLLDSNDESDETPLITPDKAGNYYFILNESDNLERFFDYSVDSPDVEIDFRPSTDSGVGNEALREVRVFSKEELETYEYRTYSILIAGFGIIMMIINIAGELKSEDTDSKSSKHRY